MTNEEALNRFKWKYSLTKDYNDPHWEGDERREHSEWVEQLEIAIKALEKQIPKKVEVTKYDIGGNDYFCHCGNKLRNGAEYCDMCGCKLDWSDTE